MRFVVLLNNVCTGFCCGYKYTFTDRVRAVQLLPTVSYAPVYAGFVFQKQRDTERESERVHTDFMGNAAAHVLCVCKHTVAAHRPTQTQHILTARFIILVTATPLIRGGGSTV